jgi:hypothetical protein
VTLPNSMLEGLTPTLAVGAATPDPVKVTVLLMLVCWSVLPVSDGMVSVVESVPVVVGVKRTVMEQVPLAAMV